MSRDGRPDSPVGTRRDDAGVTHDSALGRRRVLVIEDEASISEPLTAALRRAGLDVELAETATSGLSAFVGNEPDVVLLDVMLPDGDGRDVLRELRRSSSIPVVMVTARGEQIDKIVGLELGADDYVTKPFDTGELVARIRAVLRRVPRDGHTESLEAPSTIRVADVTLDLDARRVTRAGDSVELTVKEFELLRILCEHAGQVVRRSTLMDEVWGRDWYGSDKRLDVHMTALRHKLHDDPAHAEIIHTVRGVGFRVPPTESGDTGPADDST
jgi:two-component system, OmpR family, response regulator RegX3